MNSLVTNVNSKYRFEFGKSILYLVLPISDYKYSHLFTDYNTHLQIIYIPIYLQIIIPIYRLFYIFDLNFFPVGFPAF